MKPLKTFSLAALAALMAMTCVGASSAMAESTVLCSADEDPCSAGKVVSHVHYTSVGKAKFLAEPTIECNVLFLGDTLNLGSPLIIHGTFTYSSCNNACTVTEESGPALIEVLRQGTELASVTGEWLVKMSCFFGFPTCRFNGEGLEGHGLGPLTSSQLNGSVVIAEQELHLESGPCWEHSFLDITMTPLIHTYISS